MIEKRAALIVALIPVCVIALTRCTSVQTTYEASAGPLPRPEVVVVHDFAVSAEEVKLDSSLMGNVGDRLDRVPLSEEEVLVGHQVASALAAKLVQEIQAMGLPAVRAGSTSIRTRRVVMVEGQFLSISQGNRGERVVIGLGAGRTSVKLHSEVYGRTYEGRRLLQEMQVTAQGSRKPGMAETMGFGAAAGNLAMSAAASGAAAVGSEAFSETVEADSKRAAKSLAYRMGRYFAQQGWIEASAIPEEPLP